MAVLSAFIVIAMAWHDTMADPTVRTADLVVAGLPPDQPPLRLLLLADLHVAGPDMPPARLARIVAQANALQPDLVLLAGDFISDRRLATRHYSYREALAPLSRIRAPLGAVAVLGNHDHWRNATTARSELERAGVRVLNNEAVRLGALAVGGIDDDYTGHSDVGRTVARLRAIGGVPIVVGHSPDSFPALPAQVPLMVAGHTHCGQIALPGIGPLVSNSHFGKRYVCGLVREKGHVLVVSAGLGVSVLPFRFGVLPDMWLITLRPPNQ